MRLKTVTQGGTTTMYTYNGDGDRVAQTVGTTTTTYVLDVGTPLTMVIAETTGGQTTYYLHGLDLVAETSGSAVEYFAYDGLRSVRQILDSSGSPLLAQTFDPYGNSFSQMGTGQSAYGYSGEQTDSNGLVFLRARYYAPSMGRFMQMDPSRQERNPYQYSLNDPVNNTDPSGLIADPNSREEITKSHQGTRTEAEIADEIRDYLENTFGVSIDRDWGYWITDTYLNFSYYSSELPSSSFGDWYVDAYLACTGVWYEGDWEVFELRLVVQAVEDMASKMGGASAVREAVGGVRIERASAHPLDTINIPLRGIQTYALTWVDGSVVWVYDSTFPYDATQAHDPMLRLWSKAIITHELGHVWDYKHGRSLSSGMQQFSATGIITDRPRLEDENTIGRRQEDWAETFATYVYPKFGIMNYGAWNGLDVLAVDSGARGRCLYVEQAILTLPSGSLAGGGLCRQPGDGPR